MEVLTERDDDNRSLSTFAAAILSSAPKTGSEATHRQAVEALILGIWRNELQRRRRDAEQQAHEQTGEDQRDTLMAQAQQLTTDLNRLKRWETGEPILQLYAGATPG
jgi:spore coat polysaccharide biosynthesis predicted glycosyltransferase SpsG